MMPRPWEIYALVDPRTLRTLKPEVSNPVFA